MMGPAGYASSSSSGAAEVSVSNENRQSPNAELIGSRAADREADARQAAGDPFQRRFQQTLVSLPLDCHSQNITRPLLPIRLDLS